ncbi:MAG: TlpA family protein disulfide reductase [Bacteroidaceae bacterium]|nr:TlpA family protein disulfide reductase [Bacteroidaceae bacterium]
MQQPFSHMVRTVRHTLLALVTGLTVASWLAAGCNSTPRTASDADTLNPRRLTSGQAPRFSLPDALSGRPVATDTIIGNGRPTIILFWSSHCNHCKHRINDLQQAADSLALTTNVITVALDRDSASLRHFLRARRITLPVLTDYSGWQQRATIEYGVDRLPLLFHIDPTGEIIN